MPNFLAPLLVELPATIVQRLSLFPVDERLVPVESEESNAGAFLRLLPDKFKDKVVQLDETILDDGLKFIF